MQQHRSSSSEERREHRWEFHRQQVRLIQQQESNDRCSQSLGLAEWSVEQHVKCNSIPAGLSAWNTMYALAYVKHSRTFFSREISKATS